MNFGDCTRCGKYKYLEDEYKCRSCLGETGGDGGRGQWQLVFGQNQTVTVVETNLTEQEALEKSVSMSHIYPRKPPN